MGQLIVNIHEHPKGCTEKVNIHGAKEAIKRRLAFQSLFSELSMAAKFKDKLYEHQCSYLQTFMSQLVHKLLATSRLSVNKKGFRLFLSFSLIPRQATIVVRRPGNRAICKINPCLSQRHYSAKGVCSVE